jgi:hypothetical protein
MDDSISRSNVSLLSRAFQEGPSVTKRQAQGNNLLAMYP